MANTGSDKNYRFNCAEVGHPDCNWQASGSDEQEIMQRIEQHGRDAHNMEISEDTRNKIRNVINRQAA